ncbi:Lrp/AsnC family transcriptional regulator [Labrys neptuniae]
MKSKTKDLQPNERTERPLDDFDRKILSALSADARQTYAEIGQSAGLSAPAVHERVRRLREAGVLKGSTAVLDAAAIGKPFLAFVHVDTEGWGKSERMMTLRRYPEVEEMHSVAGDTGVIMKVRTRDARAMEHFLSQLYVLPGVRGTKSYVVLSTYLERTIQPTSTDDWPAIPLPKE